MNAPYFIITNDENIGFFDLPKPTNSTELEQFKSRYIKDFGERARKSLQISEELNKSYSLGKELDKQSWDDSFILATKKLNEAIYNVNRNTTNDLQHYRVSHVYDDNDNLVKLYTSRLCSY